MLKFMVEPEYYSKNGLSPLKAMEQGLISKEEYIGFLKGNVIKYTCRAGSKDDPLLDIVKAIDYLTHLHKALKSDDDIRKEVTHLRPKKVPVNGVKKDAEDLNNNIFRKIYRSLKQKKRIIDFPL